MLAAGVQAVPRMAGLAAAGVILWVEVERVALEFQVRVTLAEMAIMLRLTIRVVAVAEPGQRAQMGWLLWPVTAARVPTGNLLALFTLAVAAVELGLVAQQAVVVRAAVVLVAREALAQQGVTVRPTAVVVAVAGQEIFHSRAETVAQASSLFAI